MNDLSGGWIYAFDVSEDDVRCTRCGAKINYITTLGYIGENQAFHCDEERGGPEHTVREQ